MISIEKRLISAPNALPVTLDEAKASERIGTTDAAENDFITRLLSSATGLAEEFTRRAFITQSWLFRTHNIRPKIELPRPPLATIDSVATAYQEDFTIVDDTTYYSDIIRDPGSLIFKQLPTIQYGGGVWWYCGNLYNILQVTYTCGYGDDGSFVPPAIKEGILQIFGFLYQNREGQPIACGSIAHTLLSPYVVEYL
jgi:uncharacterized phiE125 gp8 family phage protein